MKLKTCPDCGSSFVCNHGDKNNSCWCNSLPPIMPLDPKMDCRCPECLKKIVKEKVEEFVIAITPENAMNCLPEKYSRYEKPVEGIDYFIENGRWVFTKWYHLKRGYCCKNGCINCPY